MPGVQVQTVADALDIHPFMLSRWRKEVRDGVLKGRARRVAPRLTGSGSVREERLTRSMGGAVIASVSGARARMCRAAGRSPAGPEVVNGPVRRGWAMAKQPGGVTRFGRRAFLRVAGAATGAA